MGIKSTSLDEYVVRSILENNQFGIKEVNNLESLKSIFFVREEYPIIEDFIKEKSIDSIKEYSEEQPNTGEYLEVMWFDDQNHKRFIVTVYDSNQLEQDPQIINIFGH